MDAIINSIKDRLEREQEERALAGRRRELCTALRDCAAYVGQRAHDDRGNETFYWDIDEDEQPEVFLERTGRLESIQVIEARAPGTWSAVNIELARTWVSAHWLAAERIIVELGEVQAVHELKPDADVFQPAYNLFCSLLDDRDLDVTADELAEVRAKLGAARYVLSGYFAWLADEFQRRWTQESPSEEPTTSSHELHRAQASAKDGPRLRLSKEHNTAELSSSRYPLTPDQFKIISVLASNRGGLVPGLKLKGGVGSSEEARKIIANMPDALRQCIDSKKGPHGGYRWVGPDLPDDA